MTRPPGVARARSRDRRVYLAGHPLLFALLTATRRRPALRIGRTVLVHDREAFVTALTRVPLDRTAEGTTGGAAGRLAGNGLLFDQDGDAHRRTRRALGDALGGTGTQRLRPLWSDVLDRRLSPLAAGGEVDLVPVAMELAGVTAASLLGIAVDPTTLARAALDAGATAARAHLPGPGRWRSGGPAAEATARLSALVAPAGEPDTGLAVMLVVATVNTTVAALPRAVAWCADAGLWAHAGPRGTALADELLRVTAPTPLLPRVAAGTGPAPGGCPVRAGDRLLLVARHAVGAHSRDPDPVGPAHPSVAQLVFGAGPHACPGARVARTQLVDLLRALAVYRPVVVRSRADRRAALPSWRTLILRARPVPTARSGAVR